MGYIHQSRLKQTGNSNEGARTKTTYISQDKTSLVISRQLPESQVPSKNELPDGRALTSCGKVLDLQFIAFMYNTCSWISSHDSHRSLLAS